MELDRFTELQQVARSLMEIADDLGNVGNTLGDHSREITTLLDQQGKVNKEIQQGLMRTGMAVSYTHLDVYKRQINWRRNCVNR